ncbi:unnamed protein product [Gordionus sp. m RMFG-2023]
MEDQVQAVLLSKLDVKKSDAYEKEEDIINNLHLKLQLRIFKISENEHDLSSAKQSIYYGKGAHEGLIVIRKYKLKSNGIIKMPDIDFRFNVFLSRANVGSETQAIEYTKENRTLSFWFDESHISSQNAMYQSTNVFLRQLFSPNEFPRDYIGFLIKVMKLMQKSVEIDTIQIKFKVEPHACHEIPLNDKSKPEIDSNFLESKLLEIIESVYPSSIMYPSIFKHIKQKYEYLEDPYIIKALEESIKKILFLFSKLNKIRQLEDQSWIRINDFTTVETIIDDVSFDNIEDTILKKRSTDYNNYNPVIAIITSNYCEKLAVDAMMENAFTLVKYKKQGSHHLYTIGDIGNYKVVSIKLSTLGQTRHAMISATNTITRLLGTFSSIKYIMLVGIGTAINKFRDYRKKFKLGDIVVSTKNPGCDYIYVRCDYSWIEPTSDTNKELKRDHEFNVKTWKPTSPRLDNLIHVIIGEHLRNPDFCPWNIYLQDALVKLKDQTDVNFNKPTTVSSEIPISIGGNDFLYLDPDTYINSNNEISIHLGAVGSFHTPGCDTLEKLENNNASLLDNISSKYGILAFDQDFDLVLDALEGNRVENYVCVRGINDHCGGSSVGNKGSNMNANEWAPYSALTAAAFMKAVIVNLNV